MAVSRTQLIIMKTTLTSSFLLFSFFSFAQSNINLKDEKFLRNELTKTKYDIDSNAKAIILYEEGYVDFANVSYDYKYEIIARVLNEDAAEDLAEVVITKRGNTNITNISAETYNLVNGDVVKNRLESDNILKDKIDDNLKVIKFNIPNVKKGSIIHYTYKIHRSDVISIPEWPFQNIYPTLYSKFALKVPNTLSYNKIIRSSKVFAKANTESQLEKCEACEFSESYESMGTYIAWARKEVPAFQKEPYSSGKDNFLERIKVIITSMPLSNGERWKLFNNWDDFSKKFLYDNDSYIGQVFKSNGFLDDVVATITKESKTDLEKAQAIFTYVRSHYNLTDNDDNIKSVFKNQKGDVFGLNMLLVAMMKNAHLNCDPVVLSTKSNERLSQLYPSAYDLNYLIGYFRDGNKEYLLDASSGTLPFGILKPECYNGYARIVNKMGGEINLSPDNIKDKTTMIVNITPSADNASLIVKVDSKLGTFSSIDFRNEAKSDSTEAKHKFAQKLTGNSVNIIPETINFKNFSNPDLPVSIHYEGILKSDTAANLFYLSPYFVKFFNKNPFTSTERSLPIEFDYNDEITYIFNLTLPENYQMDDFPTSTAIKLSDDDRMQFSNIYNYDESRKIFNLVSKFQTTTTTYNASEYHNIRTVYEKMIEEQSKKIVLKRIGR